MRKSCPEGPGANSDEFEEMHRRALEPFRPKHTMEDVLKREAEIREASIDYLKQEAARTRQSKKDIEVERVSNIPTLEFLPEFDF